MNLRITEFEQEVVLTIDQITIEEELRQNINK